MDRLKLEVKSNTLIADKIYSTDLYCAPSEYPIESFLPGQFLHIKCGNGIDPILRRPISICDVDKEKRIINMIYRVEGKGTAELAKAREGDLLDVLGPLGQGFPTDTVSNGQTALMVGGGIGVPPLYYLAKELKKKGAKIKAVIGFNSAKDVFLEKEFAELGDVYVSTMDGSQGHNGLVTDLFTGNPKESSEEEIKNWDSLFTCGPTPMLKAIQKKVPLFIGDKKADAYMSLEERMGCGVGACLACVCKPTENVGKEISAWEKSYSKICCDGPVFELQEVAI